MKADVIIHDIPTGREGWGIRDCGGHWGYAGLS
jgi:hypothetical protein